MMTIHGSRKLIRATTQNALRALFAVSSVIRFPSPSLHHQLAYVDLLGALVLLIFHKRRRNYEQTVANTHQIEANGAGARRLSETTDNTAAGIQCRQKRTIIILTLDKAPASRQR